MKTQSKTDWTRVKGEAKANKPIPVDVASEPYDPNDENAVFSHWADASIHQQGEVIGQISSV